MKVTQTEIQCSIEEWNCYNNDLCETPLSVVEEVNQNILEILSTTHSPLLAQERVYNFLNQYKEYGFRDSECDQVSTDIINLYYNSNISKFETYVNEFYSR